MRVAPVQVARGGFAAGCLVAVVGVGLAAGLALALIVGGVVLAVACLVLVEVDRPPSEQVRDHAGARPVSVDLDPGQVGER